MAGALVGHGGLPDRAALPRPQVGARPVKTDPTVGICLGPSGSPGGVDASYERGTPVERWTGVPLPSTEGTISKILRPVALKPRPDSGHDCFMCAKLAR